MRTCLDVACGACQKLCMCFAPLNGPKPKASYLRQGQGYTRYLVRWKRGQRPAQARHGAVIAGLQSCGLRQQRCKQDGCINEPSMF